MLAHYEIMCLSTMRLIPTSHMLLVPQHPEVPDHHLEVICSVDLSSEDQLMPNVLTLHADLHGIFCMRFCNPITWK